MQQKITLRSIYNVLFFIGLFFFPFNSFEGLKVFGEYKNESAAYFFFAGFVLLVVDVLFKKKVSIPYNNIIFKILLFFFLWAIVATLINLSGVSTSYFKHTTGFVRFIRQYISLLISGLIFPFFYWNVLAKMTLSEILLKTRKTFLYSLIIAVIYGFLELFVYKFGYNFLYPLIKIFNYFPFLEEKILSNGRISSISYEPPFFAVYLISISGWMFSYILTEKNNYKYLPTLAILILTYYSGSRTGLIVIFIQLIIFLSISLSKKQKIIVSLAVLVLFSISSVYFLTVNQSNALNDISKKIESLDFKGNLKKNISNQSRFGIQYASIKVFMDHPISGVGFGQQAYHAKKYYPGWAKSNNWEFKYLYLNSNEPSFPPGYNLYTRLLAETGIIGILIFLFLIFVSVSQTMRFIRDQDQEIKILGIILLVTFAGLYINWLQIDTFRVYILWFSLCVLMKLNSVKNKNNTFN